MATLDEEDAPFDAPPSCANNPNASAMGAAEWAASAGSSGEAYAPFVTIIEAQALRLCRKAAVTRPHDKAERPASTASTANTAV